MTTALGRQDTDRISLFAAVTLMSVMAAHVLLETGVDALFLANIPVERLPLITIAMAFVALWVTRLDGGLDHRRVLIGLQFTVSEGTLGLWALAQSGSEWVYYALYGWSSIATSLIVVRFWLLLGDLFTIGEGKASFARIAMGGSIGALAGSGLAVLIAPALGGGGLLLAAALIFFLGSVGPLFFLPTPSGSDSVAEGDPGLGLKASWDAVIESPYACRVAILVVVAGSRSRSVTTCSRVF